ncbi:protein of unknown function DUF627, N-terminal [Dillenia turbinata]|uniref:DUF627 domain-containing protein n=1 Tax=Dillenia turbinata TaxID=194707 RepID=A0AAN8ZAI5_9MAGN
MTKRISASQPKSPLPPTPPPQLPSTPEARDKCGYIKVCESERVLTVLRRGNKTKALILMKEFMQKYGDTSGEVHRIQSYVYHGVALSVAEPHLKQKHLRNAVQSARKAIELNPNSLESLYFLAYLLYELADHKDDFEEALFRITEFQEQILCSFERHRDDGYSCVFCGLFDVFTSLHIALDDPQDGPVSPRSLRSALSKFAEGQMNDAAEVKQANSSFEELFKYVEMNSKLGCMSEKGGCGMLNTVQLFLRAPPHVFITGRHLTYALLFFRSAMALALHNRL